MFPYFRQNGAGNASPNWNYIICDRAPSSLQLVVSGWCGAKYGRSDRYLAITVS
ncbi:hypothetical protein H6F74_24775 [Trichocoleus sp. FACHB-90]|uniref:hypothetical protein n=1 Tax=Cyanophyceae TaxID=3028117 RepID=UPI001687ABB7|nr:hypothetical protein [Trichocoleus sp. FACHB-90]MBD1929432.1 hypothetical protein [Trichocoleus sp. FACHB-90]